MKRLPDGPPFAIALGGSRAANRTDIGLGLRKLQAEIERVALGNNQVRRRRLELSYAGHQWKNRQGDGQTISLEKTHLARISHER
jgi:hypothetical protein